MTQRNDKRTVSVRISPETERQIKWLRRHSIGGFSLSVFIENTVRRICEAESYPEGHQKGAMRNDH